MLGALIEQHALGQTGGAAGVHEDDGIVLFGFGGTIGAPAPMQVLVAHVVRSVAVADEHDMTQRQLAAHLGDVAGEVVGEQRVDEHDLATPSRPG